jgi:acetyl-CoA carboxylase beta subunit
MVQNSQNLGQNLEIQTVHRCRNMFCHYMCMMNWNENPCYRKPTQSCQRTEITDNVILKCENQDTEFYVADVILGLNACVNIRLIQRLDAHFITRQVTKEQFFKGND